MTIAATLRKAGPYDGTGVRTLFPFLFKVFVASDLLVIRTDAAGTEFTLVLDHDYTVSLSQDQDANPGGFVILTEAAAVGELVTLTSAVPYIQPLQLTNSGGFYPSVINAAFDRVCMQIQQLAEQSARTFKVPISSVPAAVFSIMEYLNASSIAATLANTAAVNAGISAEGARRYYEATMAAAETALGLREPVDLAIAYIDLHSVPRITFEAMYTAGGWNMGGLPGAGLAFSSERGASRAASFAFGTSTIDLGAPT